jgi:DNA polymerase I-like protein with 3'-5' exonuclease and polymerase domains
LRSKYIVKYQNVVGKDGILRYELNQLATGDDESEERGTVSGRFSSSGGPKNDPFGVNIQQVFSPDNQAKSLVARWMLRRLMVPGSGQWFRADAKQIEYRLFAHYANSKKINDVYARDPEADFHQTVCDLLRTVIEINRKHTKNVNFACVFGAGMGKFAEMCGLVDGYGWQEFTPRDGNTRRWFGPIPNQQAKDLYLAYMGMFPEVKPLLKKEAALVENRGYVKCADGRRARCYKKPHSALNRVIQGTAASIAKRKMVRAYEERKALELTLRFVVHDELDADLRNPAKFDKVSEMLNDQDFAEFMNKETGRRETSRIPILWDCGTGENWHAAG